MLGPAQGVVDDVEVRGPSSDLVSLGDAAAVSDAAVLVGARAGRAECWDQLVRRYQGLVYSVARRVGLGPSDAADVTQATFVAFLEVVTRLRDDERVAAWLVTVARRRAWRVLRRLSRETPQAQLPEIVVDQVLDWERVSILHTALHRLANPCRDLLVALYLDPSEPSYAEIAARFHRSVGGIGPLRGRCLARIRALIEEDAG